MEIKGWILLLSNNSSWSDRSAENLLEILGSLGREKPCFTPADGSCAGKVALTCNSGLQTSPSHAALALVCFPEARLFRSPFCFPGLSPGQLSVLSLLSAEVKNFLSSRVLLLTRRSSGFWVVRGRIRKEEQLYRIPDTEHEWSADRIAQTRQPSGVMLLSYIINPLITPPDGQRSALAGREEEQRGVCRSLGALWTACHWGGNSGEAAALRCDQVDQASYFDRQLNDVFWKEEKRA